MQGSLNLLLVVSVTNASFAVLLAGSYLLLLFDGFHDSLHAYYLMDGSLDQFFFYSSTAYPTVRVPYCSIAGTTTSSRAHPSSPLVDDFANIPRAVDCSPNRSFLRLSTAFPMVCAPYCLTDGSLERYFFCSSMAYPTVNVLYCSMAGTTARSWSHPSPPPVDDFASIPRTVDCLRYCSFFLWSMAFTTVCVLYCLADGSGLLILALVNGFHDGFCAVFLSGWQRIAHSFSYQRLSRWFAHRIAQRMVGDCSYFRSSTAFTMARVSHGSADGSAFLILLLVNSLHDGSYAVWLSGW